MASPQFWSGRPVVVTGHTGFKGTWLAVTSNIWSRSGINQGVDVHNVMRFVASGATALGGERPINLSGGLVSKGHPVGATGLSMIHELALQLRGEAGERQHPGAHIGLAENGGGVIGFDEAACAVTILEKV